MKTRKNILLTGASGTVGFEVLKQLYQKRDTIDLTVFDIKTKTSKAKFAPYKKEVGIIYGDITNEDDLLKVCSGKDIVIHLAAIIPPLADDKPELYFKVNALGTEKLIRNLEKYSPGAFFLYSSSVSVYGDRVSDPWIKVGDPLNPSPGDEYAKAKIKAEEFIQRSKLDWCIFRLSAIMGGHKISKLMFHQPLLTSFEITTPEDTARAFVNALDKTNLLSKKIYNLGGGASCRLSYKDFLTRSFEIEGLGKLDFPEKTFAEKNFHCGYFADGDELEKILHFRKDTIDSYFEKEKQKINPLKRFVYSVFRKQIKKNLLKVSEPWQAYQANDQKRMNRFFYDPWQTRGLKPA